MNVWRYPITNNTPLLQPLFQHPFGTTTNVDNAPIVKSPHLTIPLLNQPLLTNPLLYKPFCTTSFCTTLSLQLPMLTTPLLYNPPSLQQMIEVLSTIVIFY